MLRYQIIETQRAGQTQYVGRIVLDACLDQEQLIERMVERSPAVRRETLVSALMLLKSTVADLCREGKAVRLEGFVRFCPILGGSFRDPTDQFDRKRHKVTVVAGVSPAFQTRMRQRLSMHRVEPSNHRPLIHEVKDHESGTRNQSVTPGQVVSLKGYRLIFNPKDPRESLEFRDSCDPLQKIVIPNPVFLKSTEVCFVMPFVPFAEGVFALTSTLGTTKPRTGLSQPVHVGYPTSC
jgi:hypothetical protein